MVEQKKDEAEDEIPTLEFDAGWDVWGEDSKKEDPEGNERPTLVPAFDVEAFARENAASKAGDSLQKLIPTLAAAAPPPAPGPAAAAPQAASPAAVATPVPFERASPNARPTMPPPGSEPPPRQAARPAASPASQPFSQRSTPPHGIVTPRQVAQASSGAAPAADLADRSARPTTLRVDPETLLALANKVAGSYAPAPAYDDALAPEPEPAPAKKETPRANAVAKADETAAGAANDPSAEMRDRFALGDYSGALVMAESLLEENPTLGEALEYADSCRSMLTKMYTARIGPLDRVPVVEVQRDQLRWLSIDHRAGFVLSLVDGESILEMILDVSGMRELDALRILFELVQQRIISFR